MSQKKASKTQRMFVAQSTTVAPGRVLCHLRPVGSTGDKPVAAAGMGSVDIHVADFVTSEAPDDHTEYDVAVTITPAKKEGE